MLSILPVFRQILTKQGLASLTLPLDAGIIWSVHFVLEFAALDAVGLPPMFILAHLATLPIGALICLHYVSKRSI